MKILHTSQLDQSLITDFLVTHWVSPQMVTSTGVFDCDKLEGFAVLKNDKVIGLLTYVINDDECEIVSLDSVEESRGIGTALVKELEQIAKENGCRIIRLITTNDNLNALKFYQKRGYRCVKILQNAVDEARKIKPEIPLIGYHGIPIKDEFLLEKLI